MFTFGLRSGTGAGGTVIVSGEYTASIDNAILSANCLDVFSADINTDVLTADIEPMLTATINLDTNEADICPVN